MTQKEIKALAEGLARVEPENEDGHGWLVWLRCVRQIAERIFPGPTDEDHDHQERFFTACRYRQGAELRADRARRI